MARTTQTIIGKTIQDRLVYTGTIAADDGTGACVSNIVSVPKGTLMTLVLSVTTVTAGNYWHKAILQGSFDKSNFVTLLTLSCDANGTSAATMLNAAGSIAATHNPATAGDYPYYRVSTIAENASAGHVGFVNLLVG